MSAAALQFVNHDLLVGLQVTGATAVLLWLLTRSVLCRTALGLVKRFPALLVPTAMAATAALLATSFHGAPALTEQPILLVDLFGAAAWPAVVWFVAVSAAFAGQIGLLDAIDAGRPPDGDAFLRGIRSHTATMILARLGIAGSLALIAWFLPTLRGPGLILCVVPSLLLVPAIGVASRHPGRPITALRETLSFSHTRLGAVGGPLMGQMLLLIGVAYSRSLFDSHHADFHDVALYSSGLGLNVFPHAIVADSPLAAIVATLGCMAGSMLFATAQWIGVRHGYEAPDLEALTNPGSPPA